MEKTVELIERDHVDAIIGPVTSASRDAIRPSIERFKTPLLYATDYEGGVYPLHHLLQRVAGKRVDLLIPDVRQNYGDAFDLVGSNYIWPKKMNQAVRLAAGKAGARAVGEEYVPFGTKDFTSILRKIDPWEPRRR